MKIRGKLIISFLIIAIFPLCAGLVCFHLIVQNQTDILSSYYSTESENSYDYGLVLNPVQLLYKLTLNDYNKLVKLADEYPDKLLDKNFLNDTSRSISSKDSFIVVFKGCRLLVNIPTAKTIISLLTRKVRHLPVAKTFIFLMELRDSFFL